MSVIEILASPDMFPYEVAFGVVLGLLLLELVMNVLGFSSLMETGDGPEIDVDTDIDLEVDFDTTLDVDLAGDVDLDLPADAGDISPTANGLAPGAPTGLLGWLGLSAVPLTLWLASWLTAFALTGYLVQLGAASLFGRTLSSPLVWMAVAVPATGLGSWIARTLGRLIPKSETTAISTRSYGKRRGVITVGLATADKPAQARFTDGHGNMHYAMVTPLDPKDRLPQGTEILILRSRDGALKALPISD